MTREERIKGAIQEFMTNQAKLGDRGRKWKAVKLFSLDRDDPQGKRTGDFMTSKGRKLYANRQEETREGQ